LAAGGHGWVSGILNVAPGAALDMYRAVVEDQDVKRGLEVWKKILPIVHLYTYQKLGPAADIPIYRGMLQLWGRHGGYSREPFSALTGEQLEQLGEELRAAGWLK